MFKYYCSRSKHVYFMDGIINEICAGHYNGDRDDGYILSILDHWECCNCNGFIQRPASL